MPARRIRVDGREWAVYPSGFLTMNSGDEYGLVFVSDANGAREVRVTRYAPLAKAGRDRSLAVLSESELVALHRMSQPGSTSPEAGYRK